MKFKNLILIFFLFFLLTQNIFGQSLKIMPDGVVIPKADHTAVVLQENGQMVYDTVTRTVWYFNNSVWREVGSDDLGNHIATQNLDMANNKIMGVSAPTNDNDGANKLYVDEHEDADPDPMNEFQTMTASTDGDTLYLSNGNYLIVPGISDANYIKDFDGNVYNEVEIGSQIWLKENLKTTHYNDGTPITLVTDDATWVTWEQSWNGSEYTGAFDAYSWYQNDSTTYSKFGALYNWGVVDSTINGGKNACPIGYIVPTGDDLQTLIAATGGNLAGLHLKYAPGEWWLNDLNFPFGGKGDNSSGFSAVGSGFRQINGPSTDIQETNWIWSRTGDLDRTIRAIRIQYDEWEADFSTDETGSEGYSIRCIKE